MKKWDWSYLLFGVPIFIFIVLPLIAWFMTTDPGARPVSDISLPAYQTQEFCWAFAKAMRFGFLLMAGIFTPVIIHHIYKSVTDPNYNPCDDM